MWQRATILCAFSILLPILTACLPLSADRNDQSGNDRTRTERTEVSQNAPGKTHTGKAQSTMTSTPETTQIITQKRSEAFMELRVKLRDLADGSQGHVGIVVKDLGGNFNGEEIGVNEEEVFESASLIKLLILAELLQQVDEGKISLEEPLGGSTVGQLAESMIIVSDNSATNLLIDQIGFEPINALAQDLGLKHTSLHRHMLDFEAKARGEDNYTSASDIVTLLSAIWQGRLLSPSSRRFALSVLERQQLNTKIPAGLPSGTRVLHKTGELEGIEHDAGIVVLSDGAFAVAVLTQGDIASGIEIIQQAASLSYEAFSVSTSH